MWDLVRLAIVGSRSYPKKSLVQKYVSGIASEVTSGRYAGPSIEIWSGGAMGVDTWAVNEAQRLRMPVRVVLADWAKHGRRAGLIRNDELVTAVDYVTAFWDGSSTGTAYTIQKARFAGKLHKVFGPDGELMRMG